MALDIIDLRAGYMVTDICGDHDVDVATIIPMKPEQTANWMVSLHYPEEPLGDLANRPFKSLEAAKFWVYSQYLEHLNR